MAIDINTSIDRIFYINLDKDVERNAHMLEQFAKHNITNYERFPAIEGTLEMAQTYNFFGPFNHEVGQNGCDRLTCPLCIRYKKGSVGCLLSHRRIFEMAKERRYQHIIILEDDVEFVDNFGAKFAEQVSRFVKDVGYWNILYLGFGGYEKNPKNVLINDYLMKIIGGYGAYGYMINSNIFDYLILNIDYARVEIDLLFNSLNSKNAIHSYLLKDKLINHNDIYESNIQPQPKK